MRRLPTEQKPNSDLGFFLLSLYTFLILARPHEWVEPALTFPFIKITLIFTFLLFLFTVKPKHIPPQAIALIGILIVIFLSCLRNGLFSAIFPSMIDFSVTAVLPFIIFVSFLDTLKKHVYIMKIMLFASLFMIYNSYTQISNTAGFGWVADAIFRSDMDGMQVRYVGILNDPNDLGMYLVMCLPLTYYLMQLSQSSLGKLYYLSVFFLSAANIYWTQSRGSILGALVVLFFFFYIRYGKAKTILLSLVTLPVVILVLSKFRAISSDDESANDRLEAWYQGVLMFKSHPIVGVGKGQFIEHHYKTAHNSYVLIMSELGTFGYILWAFVLISTFTLLAKITKIDINSIPEKLKENIVQEKNLALFMIVSLAGCLSTAFFLSRSYIIFLYIFLAMSISIFYRLVNAGIMQKADLSNIVLKSFVWSAFSLVALYFVIRMLI